MNNASLKNYLTKKTEGLPSLIVRFDSGTRFEIPAIAWILFDVINRMDPEKWDEESSPAVMEEASFAIEEYMNTLGLQIRDYAAMGVSWEYLEPFAIPMERAGECLADMWELKKFDEEREGEAP